MPEIAENFCQSCGACCSYSANWPRFTIEDDAALDLIPAKYVNARQSGMRCDGDRCSALTGDVGCNMARRRHGLSPIAVPANAGTHTA